jgi:hypothetical protein
MLAFYGAFLLFGSRVHGLLQPLSIPGWRAAARDDPAQFLEAYAPVLGVILTLPVWLFLLLFALRRWRRWSTAVIGGLLAIAVGLASTGGATWLATLLLR